MQGFSPRPNKRAGILEAIYYRKLSYRVIKFGELGFCHPRACPGDLDIGQADNVKVPTYAGMTKKDLTSKQIYVKIIHHSSFIIHHSSFIIHHSSFIRGIPVSLSTYCTAALPAVRRVPVS
jgi:hypothetical protein